METQRKFVSIKLIHPEAKVPVYSSPGAAGFDLYSVENKTLEPGERAMVCTGVEMEILKGYCVQFMDRSGMGFKGIHHFAGLIDSDYRGELKVILFNSTKDKYEIKKGERIIQGVLLPVIQGDFNVVKELNDTVRNKGGFNSTGN